MTSRTLYPAIAVAFALTAVAVVGATDGDDTVVASVNGSEVTESMLDTYANQREQLRGEKASREQLIGEVVSKELVYQDGMKQGRDKDPEVISRLAELHRDLIIGSTLDAWSEANPPSDEEVQAVYDEAVVQSAGSEYKARHILLANEADALAVIVELDGGADFAELAKVKSTGPSGPEGGDLGWFRAKSMVPEFADATRGMEKGSYSKTPVKTQFGWHVILLEDERPIAPPPLDQVRPQIVEQLAQLKLQTYIEGLRSAGDVVIK